MDLAVNTLFLGFNPKIITHTRQTVNVPSLTCRRVCTSSSNHDEVRLGNFAGQSYPRRSHKCFPSISAVLSGAKDVEVSSSQFNDISVTTTDNTEPGELKISIEVSGTKTQAIFDEVFDKMVAQAQPIPGFRRVKGGKTPNIPKDVLLEVIGPSKVFKQVIKKVINSTVNEYVEKEGLKVSKELRVEQSFEDLLSMFKEGEQFNFDAVLQIQEKED
ncbi:uncharacterized protein LOC133781442 [Humulus lupulus]|uniref:uncharacterized protein LOC133781442 n=1 Tax=Humulus lupulus TaxID=3486 RepID=UPI002B40633F|nr:uncharacterized protein LOC133781442 [Humulus lupulus]